LNQWQKENIDLITSLSDDTIDSLKETIDLSGNVDWGALQPLLESRLEVSASRAELIARDQTLKLNANVTQWRQTEAGVERYIWTTSNDERVREGHADLDGEEFSWDDPPDTGDGERNHPGEDFQCRCIAYPVIPELDDEEPASDDDEEAPDVEPADVDATALPEDDTELPEDDTALPELGTELPEHGSELPAMRLAELEAAVEEAARATVRERG
jgi:SPP1 gp7 family putative phage head morphogenesis protein